MIEVPLYARTRAPKRVRTSRAILKLSCRVRGTHPSTFEGGGVVGGDGHTRTIHSSPAYKIARFICERRTAPFSGPVAGVACLIQRFRTRARESVN